MPPSASSEASEPRRDDAEHRDDESRRDGAFADEDICRSAPDRWRGPETVLLRQPALRGAPPAPGAAGKRGDWCARYDPRGRVWHLEDAGAAADGAAEPKAARAAAARGRAPRAAASGAAVDARASHGAATAWNVLPTHASDSEPDSDDSDVAALPRPPDYWPGEDGDPQPKRHRRRPRRRRAPSDAKGGGGAKGGDSDDGDAKRGSRRRRDSK